MSMLFISLSLICAIAMPETYQQQQAREKEQQAATIKAQKEREAAHHEATYTAQQEREAKQHAFVYENQQNREDFEHDLTQTFQILREFFQHNEYQMPSTTEIDQLVAKITALFNDWKPESIKWVFVFINYYKQPNIIETVMMPFFKSSKFADVATSVKVSQDISIYLFNPNRTPNQQQLN